MMYSEFVAGTGCKQNEHNYKVFQNLEAMYSNTDMTKEEVYEYGKKLVDNSKTEEQMRIEKEVNEEIMKINDEIEFHKREVERLEWLLSVEDSKYWMKRYRADIRRNRDFIRSCKSQISALKWVLA